MHHTDYCCNYYAVGADLDPFRKTPFHHNYAHYHNYYHYYDDDDGSVVPNNSLCMELCNRKQFDMEPQVAECLHGGGTHHSCNSYALVGSHIETDLGSDLKKRKSKHGNGHVVRGPSDLCNLCCGCSNGLHQAFVENIYGQLMTGVGYQDKVELHLVT